MLNRVTQKIRDVLGITALEERLQEAYERCNELQTMLEEVSEEVTREVTSQIDRQIEEAVEDALDMQGLTENLAQEIDLDDLAGRLDVSDIACELDDSDIAYHLDYDKLAGSVDCDELAVMLSERFTPDYERLAAELAIRVFKHQVAEGVRKEVADLREVVGNLANLVGHDVVTK